MTTTLRLATAFLIVLCSAFTAAAAAAVPPAETPAAAPLAVEDLGTPLNTMRRAGDFLVAKPEGKGWWFITSYNPMRRSSMKNQIFVVDLDAKTYKVVWGPAGGGLFYAWSNKGLWGPDGRFYFAQYGSVGLYAFDPATGTPEYYSCDAVTDRVSAMLMQLSADGKIFLGTASGHAYLISFDPKTREWRNYGVPGPQRPAPMYLWSMAVSDKYVYCGMGKNPWALVAVERETGAQKVLLGNIAMEYLTVNGGGDHCRAAVTYRPDPKKKDTVTDHYVLQDGDAVPAGDKRPAAPAPKAAKGKPAPPPELVLTLARPTSEGKAQIWFRMPGKDWDRVDLEGIQTTPWKSVFLRAMPDGRIIGAPRAYEDIFIYDPKSGKTTIVGKATMSMGRMECIGGKVYMCGYPGTIVHEYDPSKPWTYFTTTPAHKEPALESPDSNPRFCARLGDICRTHHVHGTAIGADNCLYVGGHAERLNVGGGLMWYDPVTRKSGGIREPFELQDCAGLCAARNGKLIVYSSHPVADPRKQRPTPKQAELFVLDVATREIIADFTPVPGMRSGGPITAVGDKVVGVALVDKQHVLYVVDLASRKTLHTQPLADGAANLEVGPDGKVYTFIGNVLTRIDPETYALSPLGSIDTTGFIAFLGNDIYLTGYNLRRIRDVPSLK